MPTACIWAKARHARSGSPPPAGAGIPDRSDGQHLRRHQTGAGQGADYIGLGPFRFTQTKRNLSPVLGLEGYRTIMERCRNAGIALPVVAIGGITAADMENILATGVTGIALSGALLQAENTLEETQRIINIINRTKQ